VSISPRDRLIVTIALAVLVVVALVAFLVYPKFQELTRLGDELVTATQEMDGARLQLEQRRAFKDRAIETSAKWLRLQNQVPENPDLPALIIELQDTAFKSGVQVVTVTPSSPVADELAPGVSKIPVTVEVIGSWADAIDFMESMLRLDRGLRVANVTSRVTDNAAVVDKRNSPLHSYGVDSIIVLEAYAIPGTSATATPAATQ
jgi:type IV pilus assembly protein PilO